jgi:hypothetical protein
VKIGEILKVGKREGEIEDIVDRQLRESLFCKDS